MTKKELKMLRIVGLDAAVTSEYYAKESTLCLAEKIENERCIGVMRAIYYISPNEYDRITSFIREHFPAKHAIYSGNLFKITAALKADYYAQYEQ